VPEGMTAVLIASSEGENFAVWNELYDQLMEAAGSL
jgi:hypothetical protein